MQIPWVGVFGHDRRQRWLGRLLNGESPRSTLCGRLEISVKEIGHEGRARPRRPDPKILAPRVGFEPTTSRLTVNSRLNSLLLVAMSCNRKQSLIVCFFT